LLCEVIKVNLAVERGPKWLDKHMTKSHLHSDVMLEPRLRFRQYKTKPTTLHYLCPVTYLTSSNANNQAAGSGLDDTDQPSTHPAGNSAPSQLFIELNHLQRVNATKATAPRRGRFRIANKLCESNPRLPCACVQTLRIDHTSKSNYNFQFSYNYDTDNDSDTVPPARSASHLLLRQDSEY
jgi:hypothetical protein